MVNVTMDLCEQKHNELKSAFARIESKLDDALEMIIGNGKPGIRETQAEVARLKNDFERSCAQIKEELQRDRDKRDSWIMTFLRPLLPIIYGAIFGGLYIGLS